MDENLIMLSAVVALFSPIVISLITQPRWSAKVKTGIMLGYSLIVGVLTAYLSGQFDGVDILGAILTTILVTATSYQTIFKPSGISQKVEAVTSPKPIHEADVTG